MADVYEMMNTSGALRAELEIKKSKIQIDDDTEYSTEEKSIDELIMVAIESLDGIDEDTILTLKTMSQQYLNAAREMQSK